MLKISNKKGISAIVATVLIILITVAAVTIIWAAIIPMVSNQLEKGTQCLDATQQITLPNAGYTCTDAAGTYFQLKRGGNDAGIMDIIVSVTFENGTSISYSLEDASSGLLYADGTTAVTSMPEAGEMTTYLAPGPSVSISAAPKIVIGNEEVACDTAATIQPNPCA
jgi:flagellin-like protein